MAIAIGLGSLLLTLLFFPLGLIGTIAALTLAILARSRAATATPVVRRRARIAVGIAVVDVVAQAGIILLVLVAIFQLSGQD